MQKVDASGTNPVNLDRSSESATRATCLGAKKSRLLSTFAKFAVFRRQLLWHLPTSGPYVLTLKMPVTYKNGPLTPLTG